MTLTEDDLKSEWEVTFETRLGNLCGSDEPTIEQWQIAYDEANEHIAQLRLLYSPTSES